MSSVTFDLDVSSSCKSFTIIIKFPNNLRICFQADLNNIGGGEIKDFMRRFKKYKRCRLEILNSKKNNVEISYNPKEKQLIFSTYNDGYIFSDIDYNSNTVDISFSLNELEHSNFYNILEELQEFYEGGDEDDEDDEDDDDDDDEDDEDEGEE
jgi:hypothetical protein